MHEQQQDETRTYDEPVVPEGKRPTQLTVGEIGFASRAAGFNLMSAFGEEDDPRQPLAWAHIAWMWARRRYPGATLEDFTDMDYQELFRLLRIGGTPAEESEEGEVDPTERPHG